MARSVDTCPDGVAARAEADQRRIRAGYLLGMFAGLFGMLGGFAALLAWLEAETEATRVQLAAFGFDPAGAPDGA